MNEIISQKIIDIYVISLDDDVSSAIIKQFFEIVQNTMHVIWLHLLII